VVAPSPTPSRRGTEGIHGPVLRHEIDLADIEAWIAELVTPAVLWFGFAPSDRWWR
jgi:hypothetical protein